MPWLATVWELDEVWIEEAEDFWPDLRSSIWSELVVEMDSLMVLEAMALACSLLVIILVRNEVG